MFYRSKIRAAGMGAMLLWLAASRAGAAPIDVSTDFPPGTPLTMSPGGTSGPMQINLLNQNVPDAPADFLQGWQTRLQIIPDGGATGTLQFNSVSAASSGYVFGTPSILFTANILAGSDQLLAFDLQFPPVGGIQVPTSGANLLDVDYLASAGAQGTFGIFAVDLPFQTEWTDGNASARDFGNVPTGGGFVRIGEVQVGENVVPEPSSLAGWAVLLALAIPTWFFWFRRKALHGAQ